MPVDKEKQTRTLNAALGKQPDAELMVSPNDILSFDYTEYLTPEQKSMYKDVAPAIPEISYGMMFPSAQTPIQKGQYSGRMIGSGATYAPNQLIPFGVYDAKKRAVEEAAKAKIKAMNDFFAKAVPPKTKRFAVQGELDKMYFDGLQKAVPILQQRYGKNWAQAAESDVQFQRWNQSIRTIAQYEDGIVDHIAKLRALDEDKNFVLSPQTKMAANEFMMGVDGLSDPYNPQGHQAADKLLQSNAQVELDVAVNDAIEKFANDQYYIAHGKSPEGPYDAWSFTRGKGMKPEEVEKMTDTIWMAEYGGQGDFITRDMIKQRIETLFPMRVDKEFKFQDNQYNASAGGADVMLSAADYSDQPATDNFGGTYTDASGNVQQGTVTGYDGVTLSRPQALVVPNSARAIDPATGQPIEVPANTKVSVGGAKNIPVDNKGNPVTDQEFGQKFDPAKTRYTPYVVATYQEQEILDGEPTGRVINKSVWIPAKEVQSGIGKRNPDGSYKSGIDIDLMEKRAKQRQDAAAGKVTQGTPAVTPTGSTKQQGVDIQQQSPQRRTVGQGGSPSTPAQQPKQSDKPASSGAGKSLGEEKTLSTGKVIVWDGTKWVPK